MTVCTELTANASAGVSPALRAVDCLASETAAAAFGRLFGSGGALMPALTILLTLYIGFFALSLLTGRSRIGISALTPRMMTLGLVLTFATSWVAYQGVVWTLATGAPDQIAGILTGARGSATTIFADRMDLILAAITEAAGANAQAAGAGGTPAAAQGSFTPGNLTWLSALLLLLGTVGVLVTARIALAVLLALGPVFVVMALFPGTRGLTAGWLRGVVMTAVTPLFVVLGASLTMELLIPVVNRLLEPDGIDGRAALALFTIASVHLALMAMMLKVTGSLVAGWQVFGLAASDTARADGGMRGAGAAGAPGEAAAAAPLMAAPTRSGAALVAVPAAALAPVPDTPGGYASAAHGGRASVMPAQIYAPAPAGLPPLPARRGHGIGSRWHQRPAQFREKMR